MSKWTPDETRRRIVCAACRYDNVIIPSVRHWDMLMHETAKHIGWDVSMKAKATQGFICNYHQFHTREEALAIALKQHQVREKHPPLHLLFSEDLY